MTEEEKMTKYEELREELIKITFSINFDPERAIELVNEMEELIPMSRDIHLEQERVELELFKLTSRKSHSL